MAKKVYALFSGSNTEAHRLGKGIIKGEGISRGSSKAYRRKGGMTRAIIQPLIEQLRVKYLSDIQWEFTKRCETLPQGQFLGIVQRLPNGKGWLILDIVFTGDNWMDCEVRLLNKHHHYYLGHYR